MLTVSDISKCKRTKSNNYNSNYKYIVSPHHISNDKNILYKPIKIHPCSAYNDGL